MRTTLPGLTGWVLPVLCARSLCPALPAGQHAAVLEWAASKLLDTPPAAGADAEHDAARHAVAAALRGLAARPPDSAADEAAEPQQAILRCVLCACMLK